jgi:phytoene dehydrogenase-like protein|tara:strand:+ start:29833 stop:31389 length:1557 start_codon:yes stop_codon:yes gene_type:complete
MTRSVVIVGAGHNGLICAAYLAKSGYEVTVLEARDRVGGGASTVSFADGYSVSGLAHILHSLSSKVCRELNLAGSGLEAGPPVDTISLDRQGQHLTLGANTVTGDGVSQKDVEAYRDFKKEFRTYAAALDPLMMNKPPRLKDMDSQDKFTLAKIGWKLRFGLGAKSMREFLRVGGINIYDVLNEIFDNETLKGAIALDAVLGHHMGPRTPNTVLTYLHRVRGENQGLQTLPPGGMGQVTQAISDAAHGFGASIRPGEKVKRILVNDGKASGVELFSGEQLHADIVVSNADAKTTFLDLVGTGELDAMFAHRVNKTRTRGTVAKVYIALRELPQFRDLSPAQLGQRLLVVPDMRYLEHAFNHAKYGEFSQAPVLEITIPSIADPSLAPAGHHVMSVSASYAPYELKDGWEQQRTVFMDNVIALIGEYAPGFEQLVVDKEILTPVDIETEYGLTGGHWHQGEMTIDQSFMMRPVHGSAQYDTPVEGLFLCGATAHPGGNVTGIPGHNAAQRILKIQGEPG